MEENMNITELTQAENMGNETEVQGEAPESKAKDEKLFTQEEVNGFVQSRIARMKGQINKEAKAEYDQKLAELQSREMKLLVKEKLDERGMSRDLADVITCADETDLNNKLDVLQRIYGGKAKEEQVSGFRVIGSGDAGKAGFTFTDPVRQAMGLDRKD